MPLNPTDLNSEELRVIDEVLGESFNGGSPYYDMFRCGTYGIPLEMCASKCKANGIAIRQKDIENWHEGKFRYDMKRFGDSNISIKRNNVMGNGKAIDDCDLDELPKIPDEFLNGNMRRFFPCSADNKPMEKWGYSDDFKPNLYMQSDAKALSPVGWVGQNMYMQPFVVMDIDGRGHGETDEQTIRFGRYFENDTLKMEDPEKPGSFHLYFKTDRLIPVRHWPWAKIDFMGNAVNAAVYLKNKRSNGLKPMELTNSIWNMIQEYQKTRRENTYA